MATILMTGITGTVMQPLAVALLEKGHTIVALVRAKKGLNPKERLSQLLEIGENRQCRLYALAGDITEPFAGVSVEDQSFWKGKVDIVLHGAGDIRFEGPFNEEVRRTNVCGTAEMMRLAQELGVADFRFIGTAYVAGDAEKFDEESLFVGQTHRNVYEETKAEAESLVREYQGDFSVYRLPVIIGDSCTGQIPSFSGYYNYFAPFWSIRQMILQRWETRQQSCINSGISVDGQGYITLPISIPSTLVGPLNVVPIDWMVYTLTRLMEIPSQGKTFHLTHPNPPMVKQTIEWSMEHLRFRGFQVVPWDDVCSHACGVASIIQKAVWRGIEPYRPYTSKNREEFSNVQLVQAVGQEYWRDPPAITADFYGRLLDYAVQRNFGRS